MTSELRRTLLVDAVIVAVLVALALILAPGYAIIGLFALLILILGAISFLIGRLRAWRRRRRVDELRRAVRSGGTLAYGTPRTAAGERTSFRSGGSPGPQAPPVRRVPPSQRARSRRRPPR